MAPLAPVRRRTSRREWPPGAVVFWWQREGGGGRGRERNQRLLPVVFWGVEAVGVAVLVGAMLLAGPPPAACSKT